MPLTDKEFLKLAKEKKYDDMLAWRLNYIRSQPTLGDKISLARWFCDTMHAFMDDPDVHQGVKRVALGIKALLQNMEQHIPPNTSAPPVAWWTALKCIENA